MKINSSIIKKIRQSNRIKGLLSVALNKSTKSIEWYCDNNNQLLTTVSALQIIREELKVTDAEIFEQEKVSV